jgi:sulfiredoxin
MMKRETFAIATIYVPVKRRATLDPKKAQEIAESILQVGLQSPSCAGSERPERGRTAVLLALPRRSMDKSVRRTCDAGTQL